MGDNSASTRVLVTIFSVYLCTVPFAAGYYNWQYARENGFMTWLLLGEIVPSAKSLVWPYFALQSRAQAQQQSRPQLGSSDPRVIGLTKQQVAEAEINKFLLAIKYSQQASYLLASDLHENLAEHPKLQEIIADRQKALEAADSVDADILNTVYPELGNHFRDEFKSGVELFLDGCKTQSRATFMASKINNDHWADWFNANRASIEEAANSAIRK